MFQSRGLRDKAWRYIKSCSIDVSWNEWAIESDAVKVHSDKVKNSLLPQNPTTTSVRCYKYFTTTKNDSQVNWWIVWFSLSERPELWMFKTFCCHERKHRWRSLTIGPEPNVADCLLKCYSFIQHFCCFKSELKQMLIVTLLICVTSWSICDIRKTCRMCIFMSTSLLSLAEDMASCLFEMQKLHRLFWCFAPPLVIWGRYMIDDGFFHNQNFIEGQTHHK